MSPAKKKAAAKKKPTKKAPGKKKPAKKAPARKKPATKKKAPGKKKPAKKAPGKKSPAKKAPAKKAAGKRAPAKKAAAKKAPAKKAASKKAPAKKKAKKLSKRAQAEADAAARRAAPPPKPGALVVARGKQVPKLGVRWTCWSCEAVFYDLNKPEAVCPKCHTDQKIQPKKEDAPRAKRDSMRALKILDDDDAATTRDEDASGEIELDLKLGTNEKLLDETEEASADSDDD